MLRDSLFGFEGRVGRMNYLVTNIIAVVPMLIALLLVSAGGVISERQNINDETRLIAVLCLIVGIAALAFATWIGVATTVKRLHDVNMSGWWTILILVLGFAAIILMIIPGTIGRNAFGDEPGEEVFSVGPKTITIPNGVTA